MNAAKKFFALALTVAAAPVFAEDGDRAKLRDQLMKMEANSWEMTRKRDVAGMREYLSDDAVLVFEDGLRYPKAEFLKFLVDFRIDSLSIDDKCDIIVLTPDAATILYRITYTSGVKNEPGRKVTVQASSCYVKRGGKWLSVFYQETPVK